MAAALGVPFVEIVLLDSRVNAIGRFHARASDAALGEMYDLLVSLVERRPRARVVRTTAGDVEGAYRDLLATVRAS